MIKAIVFDYGNVIETIKDNMFLRGISSHSDKSIIELNDLIYNSDMPGKYESGQMSSGEFYQEVVRRCKLSISIPEFIEVYTNVNTPIVTTMKLISKLKKEYKIGLLSNTSEWDFEKIIMPSESYKLFDAITLSFKIRIMKPAAGIYLDIIEKLRLKPEECVYVDDVKEYVDGACRVGMKGIQYKSYGGLVKALRKLKVTV